MQGDAIVLTRREAAHVLRVSLRTLDALLARGTLRRRRIGRRVLIPRSALLELLERDTPTAQAPASGRPPQENDV